MKRLFKFLLPVIAVGLFASCLSVKTQEKRLAVYRSAEELRLSDIRRYTGEDPIRAIHLIGMYRLAYGADSPDPSKSSADADVLAALEAEAVENLKKEQAKAVGESRWDDAASLARSLAALGLSVESTGREPDFILANAKKLLTVNDLAAFLEAVQVHTVQPLSFEDALLFLERAVLVRQRRTAAFFLAAALEVLEAENPAAPPAGPGGPSRIPAELVEYARGQDTPQDMIKGVATVLVDRGLRVEKGRGFPDWVLGSAFFVDASGFLITNYHVISSEVDPSYEGSSRMYIRLGDSSSARIPARVVGWDKALDLALIKVEYKPDYVFSVVDRVIPRVGDSVLAIGSPGGLEKTVTMGIVSALSRRFLQIGDVIQIDAAVNHGNSGGPVVDTSGRLVGIVFAGIDQYQGLNFAVPAERLAAALPAIIKGGKAERPWLGLTVAETSQGAEIIYTAPLTPAAELQIAEGSIIRTINGEKISAPQGLLIPALQDTFFSARPGELIALETSMPGAETELSRHIVRTVARPDIPLVEAAKLDSRERMAAPLFGLILAPTVGKSFSPSYLVKRVVRGSIADEAGLSEQDPVSIRGFRVLEKDGYALMEINVKKRRMGYLETTMQLPALLDSPDTL
jgi:S1-C subfamily serine protease